MYELTYEFDGSGGNIQYQTRQQVKTDATTADTDVEIVTTGLSLDQESINGLAILNLPPDIDPEMAFESAKNVQHAESPDATAYEIVHRGP